MPDRKTPEQPVHEELIDMHEDGGLSRRDAEAGAYRIRANHARELAALARASGGVTAEDTARFLEWHAAQLDLHHTN